MRLRLIAALALVSLSAGQAQDHEGTYEKNLTLKGPITGNDIIYTLYLRLDTARKTDLTR